MNLILGQYVLGDGLKKIKSEFNFFSNIYMYQSGDKLLSKVKNSVIPYLSSAFGKKLIHIYECYNRLLNFKMENIYNFFLNHGWGVKKSPGIAEIQSKKNLTSWRRLKKKTDYVICYNDFDASYFFEHELLNDIPSPKFVPLGHPRNDFLIDYKNEENFLKNQKKRLGIRPDAEVILFAPTHREPRSFGGKYDKQILELHLKELSLINKICNEKNIYILYRPHYLTNENIRTNFSNIILVDSEKEPDPRPLMLISDILITDYSSIYVDYLLLERPIVFYQPDLETYQNKLRGLVVDPNNIIHFPGPKIEKLADIFDLNNRDFEKFDLVKSKKFFHKYSDNNSLGRLVNFIKNTFSE